MERVFILFPPIQVNIIKTSKNTSWKSSKMKPPPDGSAVHLLIWPYVLVRSYFCWATLHSVYQLFVCQSLVFDKVSHLSATLSHNATSFSWSIHHHLCLPMCPTFRQHPANSTWYVPAHMLSPQHTSARQLDGTQCTVILYSSPLRSRVFTVRP